MGTLAAAGPVQLDKPVFVKDARGSGSRLVGGTQASEGQFPWQASLQRYGSHFCGASLITANHVMTAAHCANSGTTVNLGSTNWKYPEQSIAAYSVIPTTARQLSITTSASLPSPVPPPSEGMLPPL